MSVINYRPKYKPGDSVSTRHLPEGWEDHPTVYGAITPKFGQWKGTPMMADSTMSKLLGWPERCLGDIKYCYRYPDGSDMVPIYKDGIIIGRKRKRVKESTDPPSIIAQAGWIDTGLVELAWTDIDGNRVEVTCRQRRKSIPQNTDRAMQVVSKKNRRY